MLKLNLKGTRKLTSSASAVKANKPTKQPKQQRDDDRRLHILLPAYLPASWPDCAGRGRRISAGSAGVAIGSPTSQLQQKPTKPLAFCQRPVFSATASSRLQFGMTSFEADRMISNARTLLQLRLE